MTPPRCPPLWSLCLKLSLAWALACSAVATAWAERADRDKPMHVESDRLDHDDLQQISVFQGQVVLTKGTLILKGHRVEVREDPQGFQYGLVLPKPGEKAFYRQKREGVNEWIEGHAERIDYDGKADVVTLLGAARLRRYVGTQLNDEFTGEKIVYDNPRDQFSMVSGNRSQVEEKIPNRVRAILAPKRTGTAP